MPQPPNPAAAPGRNFEQCMKRLEAIVAELERSDLPLDDSILLFEEGMALSNDCRRQLDEAEGKIEILMKKNGEVQAEPLELKDE